MDKEQIKLPKWMIELVDDIMKGPPGIDDKGEEDEDSSDIFVLDPVLLEIFFFPETTPGIWVYVVEGKVCEVETELSEVPVFGLFMPFGLPRVVQKLPSKS